MMQETAKEVECVCEYMYTYTFTYFGPVEYMCVYIDVGCKTYPSLILSVQSDYSFTKLPYSH